MSARRRVVVTGMGVVSPLGHGVEPLWRGLAAGRSAVGPIRRFDASGYPTRIAAESSEPERPEEIADGLWRAASRIERFAFYDKAREAYAVIQTGETRFYGCFIFRKGVIPADA